MSDPVLPNRGQVSKAGKEVLEKKNTLLTMEK